MREGGWRGRRDRNGPGSLLSLPLLQVDNAKSLHYIGAGIAFPAGLLFVCLQCILTYHTAVSALDSRMAHLRVSLTGVALISLVLSILLAAGLPSRPPGPFASRQAGVARHGLNIHERHLCNRGAVSCRLHQGACCWLS